MAKKNLFDESEEEVGDQELKINQEYARKFEHNKKREDRHRRTFCSSTHKIHTTTTADTRYNSRGEAQDPSCQWRRLR